MELNNWSGRDQLIIIDEITMFKGSSDIKSLASQKSDIIIQYLYSAIRGDLKMITGFLYVVSGRLLVKLWDNEFSWNHDWTYLLQVMFFLCVCVFQDHNQGPCATWDISQKRILISNHAKSRLPIAYFISAQSFWNVVHCTAATLPWSVRNIKNICKLKGMLLTNEILRVFSLRWASDGYPSTLDSPIGARFFSAIPFHASQTWCDRFVLMECFSYHYCSRIWSPAQCLRCIDGQYYL